MTRSLIVVFATALLTATAIGAPEPRWQTYEDPSYGFEVELPLGMFTGSRREEGGVTLVETDGRGQIDIYGALNTEGLSVRDFEAALSDTDRIREITYARRGQSWFVISGYYRHEDDDSEDLIFYAKFMFSPDREHLSAFEASYPVSDKRRYDPIIERMEDSLTSPDLD
jgi:hypothetical protein